MTINKSDRAVNDSFFAKEMTRGGATKPVSVVLEPKYELTPGQLYRRERAAFERDDVNAPLSLVLRHRLKSDDWLSYKRNGIQTGVFKNLRTGQYPQEATLNLNKKTVQQACYELAGFINDCENMDIRSVLIFIGQGSSAVELKSYLAQWLPELENVQAFHTAQKHHGGSAAIYVLLRKSEAQRIQNRERHAARLGQTL